MYNWTNFFDKIFVINLPKRTDRLLQIAEELGKWNIPYELVNGIEHENGAEGLKLTVEGIFNDAIKHKWESILIFEDDAYFVEDCGNPNEILNAAVDQLPPIWDIIMLGGQPTTGFKYRQSANLLAVENCYATHAIGYSLHGIKEIMMAGLVAPIDNCIVSTLQPHGTTYITYPLLCSQRAGVSNIGNIFIDWNPFIIQRYNQKLGEL